MSHPHLRGVAIGALRVGYGLFADVPHFAGHNLDLIGGLGMMVSERPLAGRGAP